MKESIAGIVLTTMFLITNVALAQVGGAGGYEPPPKGKEQPAKKVERQPLPKRPNNSAPAERRF